MSSQYDALLGDKTVDAGGRLSLSSAVADVAVSAGTNVSVTAATSVAVCCGTASLTLSLPSPDADAIRAELKAQSEAALASSATGGLSSLATGAAASEGEEAAEDAEEDVAGQVTLSCGNLGFIKLTAGPPGEGAMILMTPESITFKVGEATFILTPASLVQTCGEVTSEVTNEGHNLTAGETELNVGLQGLELEGPTDGKACEAGTGEAQCLDAEKTLGTSVTSVPVNTLE